MECGRQHRCRLDGPLKRIQSRPAPFSDNSFKAMEPTIAPNVMARVDNKRAPRETLSDDAASTILVAINETQRITVQLVKATIAAGGSTWRGLVQETGESALLMRWADGRITGILGYKGRIYAVTNIGGQFHAEIEGAPRNLPSEDAPVDHGQSSEFSLPNHSLATSPKVARKQQSFATHDPPVNPFSDSERRALEAKQIQIDLMVLYTKKAASHYIITMPNLIELAIDQVNISFRNSGLNNIRLRTVHTQLIDFDDADADHFEGLYRMVDGTGRFKEIHKLRDEKRADIVGLIVDNPSGCGLSTRVAPDSEEAYFVVHHSCAFITMSIAHEVGHILGARHDRQTDTNNSPFPFGHGYVNGTKWRDIMSYQESCDGCLRIPFWSNPRIRYNGEPTGTDAEDNARVILEQAQRVSKFR
jgi:peptidyl-Asp metalloendopeptidase